MLENDNQGTIPEGAKLSELLPQDFEGRDALIENHADSVPNAMGALHSLKKELRSTTRVPAVDAGEEAWNKFYEKMNIRADQGSYPLPESDDPELVGYFEDMRAAAHEGKVSLDAWQGMVQKIQSRRSAQQAAADEQLGKALDTWKENLVSELGQQKAEETIALAKRFQDEIGVDADDPVEQALATALRIYPSTAKMLAQAALAIGPDNIPDATGGGLDPATTIKGDVERYFELQEKARDKKTDLARKQRYQNEMVEITKRVMAEGYDGVTDPRLQ